MNTSAQLSRNQDTGSDIEDLEGNFNNVSSNTVQKNKPLNAGIQLNTLTKDTSNASLRGRKDTNIRALSKNGERRPESQPNLDEDSEEERRRKKKKKKERERRRREEELKNVESED